jgi:hypothetical protein
MKKRLCIAFLLIITLFSHIITVNAITFASPQPSKTESADGSRVFIFYPPLEEAALTPMGVYYNTEPLELIFLVDPGPVVSERDLIFSADLLHFAYIPHYVLPLLLRDIPDAVPAPMRFDFNQVPALDFYENGILIKRYFIGELVENPDAVSYTTWTTTWDDYENRVFDNTNNTLTLTTLDNLTYIFDMKTGVIIDDVEAHFATANFDSIAPAPPTYDPIYLTAMIMVLLVLLICKLRQKIN